MYTRCRVTYRQTSHSIHISNTYMHANAYIYAMHIHQCTQNVRSLTGKPLTGTSSTFQRMSPTRILPPVCVCVYVCMDICMYVCIYVCMSQFHTFTHTNTHTHITSGTANDSYAGQCTHFHFHFHTHTHTSGHANRLQASTYIHTYVKRAGHDHVKTQPRKKKNTQRSSVSHQTHTHKKGYDCVDQCKKRERKGGKHKAHKALRCSVRGCACLHAQRLLRVCTYT